MPNTIVTCSWLFVTAEMMQFIIYILSGRYFDGKISLSVKYLLGVLKKQKRISYRTRTLIDIKKHRKSIKTVT